MSIQKFFLLFLYVGLFNPFAAGALEIVSLSPSIAAVGSRVTVTGGPFEDGVRVLIGELEVAATVESRRQLDFEVPALPAGDYLLNLQVGEQRTERSFVLQVVEPQPVIDSLDPQRVDLCSSDDQRRITVSGRNFATGARLLVDGAQLPAERISSSRMEFTLPELTAGLHRIQIVHPDGQASLPFGMEVDGVPEILSVVPGDDRVISYDLVIHGRNFAGNCDLMVNGVSVRFSLPTSGKSGGGRDILRYVDCQTLIYTRYPLDSEPEPLSLTVVMPGVERSAPYVITAP